MAKYPFKVTSDLKVLGENGAGPDPSHALPGSLYRHAQRDQLYRDPGRDKFGHGSCHRDGWYCQSRCTPQSVSRATRRASWVRPRSTASAGQSVISEAFVANGTAIVSGSKAFDAITNVVLPAYNNGTADSISVGVGNKLGLAHKLTLNTVLFAFLNGTKEGTAPTMASNATAIESNTATLNSTLTGSAVDIYYLVN
jgi:hypothetical protein